MAWYTEGIEYSNPKKKGRFKRLMLDTDELRKRYLSGQKIKDMAIYFRVSEATIKRHLKFIIPDSMKRNKGKISRKNETFNSQVIRLYTNHHLSTLKIANRLGCSSEKIRRRLHMCGVEVRSNSYKNLFSMHPGNLARISKTYPIEDLDDFNKAFLLMYCMNASLPQISESLGIHQHTVKRRIQFARSLFVFKLRVCKHCERMFRFISTEKKKSSEVCHLCNEVSRLHPMVRAPAEVFELLKRTV
ncbi:MAG: hypothetical protein ABII22_04485 [Candidatus Micrarchaeota archaeon]